MNNEQTLSDGGNVLDIQHAHPELQPPLPPEYDVQLHRDKVAAIKAELRTRALTEKELECLAFAAAHGVVENYF